MQCRLAKKSDGRLHRYYGVRRRCGIAAVLRRFLGTSQHQSAAFVGTYLARNVLPRSYRLRLGGKHPYLATTPALNGPAFRAGCQMPSGGNVVGNRNQLFWGKFILKQGKASTTGFGVKPPCTYL